MASDSDSCSDVFDRLTKPERGVNSGFLDADTCPTPLLSASDMYPSICHHISAGQDQHVHHTSSNYKEEKQGSVPVPVCVDKTVTARTPYDHERALSDRYLPKTARIFPSKSADWADSLFDTQSAEPPPKAIPVHCRSPVSTSSCDGYQTVNITFPADTRLGETMEARQVGPAECNLTRAACPITDKQLEVQTGWRYKTDSPPAIIERQQASDVSKVLSPHFNVNDSQECYATDVETTRVSAQTMPSVSKCHVEKQSFYHQKSVFYPRNNYLAKGKTLPLEARKKPPSWEEYISRYRNRRYEWEPRCPTTYHTDDLYLYEDSLAKRLEYSGNVNPRETVYTEPSKIVTSRSRRERKKPFEGQYDWTNRNCRCPVTLSPGYRGRHTIEPSPRYKESHAITPSPLYRSRHAPSVPIITSPRYLGSRPWALTPRYPTSQKVQHRYEYSNPRVSSCKSSHIKYYCESKPKPVASQQVVYRKEAPAVSSHTSTDPTYQGESVLYASVSSHVARTMVVGETPVTVGADAPLTIADGTSSNSHSKKHCRTGSTASQSNKDCTCHHNVGGSPGISFAAPSTTLQKLTSVSVRSLPPLSTTYYHVPVESIARNLLSRTYADAYDQSSFQQELVIPNGKIRRADVLEKRLLDMLRAQTGFRAGDKMAQAKPRFSVHLPTKHVTVAVCQTL